MELKYQVGQEVLVKVKIKEIRIGKEGKVNYEVAPIAEFNLVTISIKEEDIIPERKDAKDVSDSENF